MKKKHVRRSHRPVSRRVRPAEHYLVAVRGWMFVVTFALMLGVGALVGTFISTQMDASSPSVAGVSTE